MTKAATLPIPPTPLIGREAEIRKAGQILHQGDTRLMTLTGPGGSGKTRLGLEVASRAYRSFRDGVYFVDLAPVVDPNMVVPTIAQTLEAQGQIHMDALADKELLLLIDNFEHVMAAAGTVAQLVAGSPAVKVVVTSREALRLRGEQELPVPPLPLPNRQSSPSLAEIAQSPAVILFVQRARAVSHGFELDEANMATVAEICRRLDGLPLAIELAAARTKLFSPRALLERLEQRLNTLTAGPRDLPHRQKTLRATLDWSYQLLANDEQSLFRRLAVFSDGGAFAIIQKVAGEAQVLDALAGLVDKNLLRQESGEEPRYVMLETVREYALEKLEMSGEAEEVRRRHARAMLELLETAEDRRMTAGHVRLLDQLERERGNLREALQWSMQAEPEGLFLRLAGWSWRFWAMRGPTEEGRFWLGRAAAMSEKIAAHIDVDLILQVQMGAGEMARAQGDFEPSVGWKLQALETARASGREAVAAALLHDLAIIQAMQGQQDQALEMAREAVALRRKLGHRTGIRHALEALYFAQLCRDDTDSARETIEEAMEIAHEAGSHEAITNDRLALILLSIRKESFEETRRTLEEFVPLARELADQWASAQGIYFTGCLEAAQGHGRDAARLLGAAEELTRQGRFVLEIPRLEWLEQSIAAARAQSGETAWKREYERGRADVRDLGGADPLGILQGMVEKWREAGARKAGPGLPAGMTAREVEILQCVAQGLTDYQIAARLVISPRTVNAHLTSIYNKLGVNSRAAATRFALEQGLG